MHACCYTTRVQAVTLLALLAYVRSTTMHAVTLLVLLPAIMISIMLISSRTASTGTTMFVLVLLADIIINIILTSTIRVLLSLAIPILLVLLPLSSLFPLWLTQACHICGCWCCQKGSFYEDRWCCLNTSNELQVWQSLLRLRGYTCSSTGIEVGIVLTTN